MQRKCILIWIDIYHNILKRPIRFLWLLDQISRNGGGDKEKKNMICHLIIHVNIWSEFIKMFEQKTEMHAMHQRALTTHDMQLNMHGRHAVHNW